MHLFPNKHLLSTKNVIRTKMRSQKTVNPCLQPTVGHLAGIENIKAINSRRFRSNLLASAGITNATLASRFLGRLSYAFFSKAFKRLSDPVLKKQPVIPAFLRLLRRRLDFMRPLQRLIWGSIVLGFFFLLRRSEYIKIGAKQHDYCLRTTDVFFSDERLSCQLQSSVISDHRTVWSEERPVWSMGVAHDAPLERSPHLPGESIASYPESPARVERGIMCALVC